MLQSRSTSNEARRSPRTFTTTSSDKTARWMIQYACGYSEAQFIADALVQGDTFSAFGSQLAQTSRNAARAFGLNGQGVRQCRTIGIVVGAIFALWIVWHIASWWIAPSPTAPA